MLLKIVT